MVGESVLEHKGDGVYLKVIREYLQSNDIGYDNSLIKRIEERKKGKQYTICEHIRGMIYAMLSNQTRWSRIVRHLDEIDRLFFDYDPKRISETAPEYFLKELFAIKCGNKGIKRQMEALRENIEVFRKIEKDYGSIDAFITSEPMEKIVPKLSESASPYKLKRLGDALVAEYLRNVGIDGAKPDTHLRRFLGADRMGSATHAPATVDEVYRQVTELSEQTGLYKAEIDNLIWSFCAANYGQVCTAVPDCGHCPISKWCKYNS
ncbi:MAG: hypothetical protein IJU41_10275 [Clostridia bacterium]|nr:hypothetical protein [Clostridia bacterium]